MGKTIKDSLSILDETIKSEDFLKNRGLGNEVGYYIFDYDPKDELLVREYVRELCEQNIQIRDPSAVWAAVPRKPCKPFGAYRGKR